jgi:hypothetical protein
MSARCAYCDAELRPNSMFCLECGQLVQGAAPPVPQGIGGAQQPAAAAKPVAAAPARPRPAANEPVPLPTAWQAPGSRAAEAPDPTSTGARPAAPAPVAVSTVRLAFSTGETAVVSGGAVIGRQPQSTAQNSGLQAISITDTTRSVSRVHLMLTLRDGAVEVADAGSGNGSSLERAGVRSQLREGRPVPVHDGDRIWLGDVSADVAFA